jgi:hypothetical protein
MGNWKESFMHCIPKASLACLAASLSFAPVFSNPSTQAPGIDLQVAGDRAAIFAEGIISTPQEELSGTFSPDMREFYFTKSAPNYSNGSTQSSCPGLSMVSGRSRR